MITEMEVAEMDIQVGRLGHMVGVDVVEAHITAAEEIVPAMRGRILVMMLPNGIQLPRMVKMVGVVFQVLKFKTHLAGRLSQVVGVPVEVAVAVVVVVAVVVAVIVGVGMEGVVGGVERVAATKVGGGMVLMQMMLVLIMGVRVGELPLRRVLHSPKLEMDGLEVVVGETTLVLIYLLLVSHFQLQLIMDVLTWQL
jgi:hypothetical protein